MKSTTKIYKDNEKQIDKEIEQALYVLSIIKNRTLQWLVESAQIILYSCHRENQLTREQG